MTSEESAQPVTDDYSWTGGDNVEILHLRKIDSGAFGEVHEVHTYIPCCEILTIFSYKTAGVVKYVIQISFVYYR
jgi:hypothetical protein